MIDSAVTLMTLGGLLLLGLATDAIGRLTPLPRVTLLMLFGFLIGRSGVDLLPAGVVDWFPLVSDLALLMVAFLLGGKLRVGFLRRSGRAVITVSVAVTLATWAVVTLGCALLGLSWPQALLLGAIATATAPAAVADVVKELRSNSEFSRILLGVVAIDDAWGLILFTLMLAVVQVLLGDGDPMAALMLGSREFIGGIVLGVALGLPMAYLSGRIRPGEPLVSEAIGMVLLCGGLARWFDVSFLLAAMTLGAVVANLASHHERPFHAIENIEWPFLCLFFVLAGATVHGVDLQTLAWPVAIYAVLRIVGRLLGGAIGARWAGLPQPQRLWMGPALLPQAGVAIGMALIAAEVSPDAGKTLLPLVIMATIFFELVGPVLTRKALLQVQTAGSEPVQRRRSRAPRRPQP